jgi:leucyl aminopeptidase
VALGEHVAGLWSNDDQLLQTVHAASQKAGERLWPMPSFPEYDEQIRSDVAQIKNTGGRLAGACTGAAFLKAFAGEVPWAHLDIAYTAFREKDQAFMSRGSTGFGVFTLVELVESWSQ